MVTNGVADVVADIVAGVMADMVADEAAYVVAKVVAVVATFSFIHYPFLATTIYQKSVCIAVCAHAVFRSVMHKRFPAITRPFMQSLRSNNLSLCLL